jgi:hypothetical protein
MADMPSSPSRIFAAAAVAVTALGVLAGCAGGGPAPLPTVTVTVSPTASATPSRTPTPTPDAATPVSVDCATLLPAPQLFAIDANVAAVPPSTPPAGTLAAAAVAAKGGYCPIVHATSGQQLYVAVSAPGAAALAAARASAGTPVDLGIAGVEAFGTDAAIQAFRADRRYTVESTWFSPSEKTAVLKLALQHG